MKILQSGYKYELANGAVLAFPAPRGPHASPAPGNVTVDELQAVIDDVKAFTEREIEAPVEGEEAAPQIPLEAPIENEEEAPVEGEAQN